MVLFGFLYFFFFLRDKHTHTQSRDGRTALVAFCFWYWGFVILTHGVYACFSGRPVKDDGRMDALKCNNSVLPEETTADAAGAFVEKDGFSVEDLLDLEEFAEPDKDVAEREDDDAPPAAAAAAERSKADSQPSSVVKYDLPPLLPPPPEMVDLPVSCLGAPSLDRFYSCGKASSYPQG
jgi:hypothetical protein